MTPSAQEPRLPTVAHEGSGGGGALTSKLLLAPLAPQKGQDLQRQSGQCEEECLTLQNGSQLL